MNSHPRTQKQQRGDIGETLAREYLEDRGFKFLAANWRCKAGELDLIMKKDNELVFVEVRLRRKTSYGQGIDTVAWQKQRKLIKAAQWYVAETEQYNLPARFDVVSITLEHGGKPEIEHIEYAFGLN